MILYTSDTNQAELSGRYPYPDEDVSFDSNSYSGRNRDDWNRASIRISLVYLGISIFCAFFGAVYESFSHEVYSYYMLYAFAFPLAGGALPFLILAFFRMRKPGRYAQNLYHSGIAALTVGSVFTGVLEIYGTTNRLVAVYWVVGAALVIAGAASYAAEVIIFKVMQSEPQASDGKP